MTYQVVFDCTQPPVGVTHLVSTVSEAHLVVVALVFLALGTSLILVRRWLTELRVILCMAIMIGAYLLTLRVLPKSTELVTDTPSASAVCQRAPKVVAGAVCNFVPMPYGGHADEHFCVQNVCFQYSDYEHLGTFNNSSSHGGPIKAGLPVRVTYVEDGNYGRNSIVKLEIDR